MSDATQLAAAIDPSRSVLRVSGGDAENFLQGLLTNDVTQAGPARAVYAALLTAQGKFLYDAFVLRPDAKQFLLEVATGSAEAFLKRLTMYKLRAEIEIARVAVYKTMLLWPVCEAGQSEALATAAPGANTLGKAYYDPRHAGLGLRVLVESPRAAEAGSVSPLGAVPEDFAAYERLRVALGVPVAGDDIVRDETFPLEIGFEHIHGVDFKKGCYVGQEVTARMKHKAVLKKGLYGVDLSNAPSASPGDELKQGEKPAGTLGSVAGNRGLALLRADRADGALTVESGGTAMVDAPIFAAPSD